MSFMSFDEFYRRWHSPRAQAIRKELREKDEAKQKMRANMKKARLKLAQKQTTQQTPHEPHDFNLLETPYKPPIGAIAYAKMRTPLESHAKKSPPKGNPVSLRERFKILNRDNFTCQYCGRKPPDVTLEVDHKTPRKHGGSHHPSNLVTACWECNRGKSGMLLTHH